jgi:hypothetical protein
MSEHFDAEEISSASENPFEEFAPKPRRKSEPQINDFPIGPEELLQLEIELPNINKKVSHDLFRTLKAKVLDDPFSLSEEMDAAPIWFAYYSNLSAEADYALSVVQEDYDIWFALAYEVAKDYLDGKHDKVTETMIKTCIPGLFREKGEWNVSTGEYDPEKKEYPKEIIVLESYSTMKAKKREAEKKANLMKVYAKTFHYKVGLLPSQLSLAKSLLENPEIRTFYKTRDGSVSGKEVKIANDVNIK